MSQLGSRAHIGALNKNPRQLFKSLIDKQHSMWCSWDNVLEFVDLPKGRRQKSKAQHYQGSAIKTGAKPQDITTIASRFMAQGFFRCMIENSYNPAFIEVSNSVQFVVSWNALVATLSHNANADLFIAAFRNDNKLDHNRSSA